MPVLSVSLVQQSYARCSRNKKFFEDFYTQFIASSPEIEARFAHTSRAMQKVFVHQGITTILLFGMGSLKSETRLRQIAGRHDRNGLDIGGELYPFWVESLMYVVAAHDPQYDDEVDRAWRDLIQEGIDVFLQLY